MVKVRLYRDEGIHPLSYRQLRSFLIKLGHSCSSISADELIKEKWESDCDILAIGGGADVPYHRKLSGDGTDRIRAFVNNGGSYLGICAGSYFGCKRICFDKAGDHEVIEERDLNFFPGTAVGPAYCKPAYDPISSRGARIAPIHWFETETLSVYFNGGCYFHDAHLYSKVTILARYIALPGQPAAAVKCPFGKGKAILCGAHPEYNAALLPKKNHSSVIHTNLERSEEKRLELVAKMLCY